MKIFFIAFAAIQISFNSSAQHIKGTWSGIITHQDKEWNIAVEFIDSTNQLFAFVDFIDVGGYRREFKVQYNASKIHFERPQPNGVPIVFDGIVEKAQIKGTWSGLGVKDAVFNLKPASPSLFRTEDVVFYNDSAKLSGAIIIPKGKGKFPAVIMTHGGAAEDKMVWWGPAMQLVNEGIAVLIYDKRGVGKSTGGNWRNDGLEALAKDALAGLTLLRKRSDIDPNRIGIFGHSEGGWVGPIAANLSKEVKFIVASGASSMNGGDQTIFHLENLMRDAGFDKQQIDSASLLRKRMYYISRLCYDGKNKQQELEKLQKDLEASHNSTWFSMAQLPYPYEGNCSPKGFLHLLLFDPLKEWKKVKVPVLLIWGENDIVVPVEHGKIAIKKALYAGGNKNVSIIIEPKVNHSISLVPEKGWDFPRQAPNYFTRISKWINRHNN